MSKISKAFPWILVAVFALWVVGSLRSKRETGFRLQEFGKLPVLLNGRVQPLDSVARNSLLQMRAKQTVLLDGGKSMPAYEWIAEVMMNPDAANERKVFRIDHPEIKDMLKLSSPEKHFSFNDIKPGMPQLLKEAQRISESKKEESQRTPLEKQVLKFANGVNIYHKLQNSLKPGSTEDFAAELAKFKSTIQPGVEAVRAQQAGKEYNQQAFDAILEALSRYDFMSKVALPLMVPPLEPMKYRDGWENVGTVLMQTVKSGSFHPAVEHYAAMATAYKQNKPEDFNRRLTEYWQWLEKRGLTHETKKSRAEAFFNHSQPFYKATVFYVTAFLLGCVFWFKLSEPLRRAGVYLLVFALVIHTVGLIFRMALEGRPPVTNLYSSAIFIGWGAVILGLVLEGMFKNSIGIVCGAAIGFATQVIAHNLALGGDTMEMLRAVLDTNFWLATHVVAITIGYAATFVAGFLAIIYVLRGVLTRTLSSDIGKSLARMTYGIICFSALFSFVGTVLGGIWADQSWGRFWGWDPKENGALIIVLWNVLILHARWGGMIRERGLMNMAIFGNIVTSFSWFGVNMLGIGLHSYGFMDQAFKWLLLFIVSQLALIGIGLIPVRFWKSFRSADVPPPGKTGSGTPAPQQLQPVDA